MTLRSDANGLISLVGLPHPLCSTIDMTTSSILASSQLRYSSNNPNFYAATSYANLNGALSSYRVVGCGF